MSSREGVTQSLAVATDRPLRAQIDRSASRYSIVFDRSGARAIPSYAGHFDPAKDARWQRLWLTLQRSSWTTLAVATVAPSTSALDTARALSWVGGHHLDRPIGVLDASELELSGLEPVLSDLRGRRDAGSLTILSLAPLTASPVGLAMGQFADAFVLLLRLGDRIADAQRTIDEIGAEKCLGTVLMHPKEEQ